jgi:DNA-directed RNA polymerase sigma subunit (sigma70/sigma32)
MQEAIVPHAPEALGEHVDPVDLQRRQLPALLERLDPTARRLIWHRYLREHPLTPHQLKPVMGLTVEEQERVEREALQVLREGVG